MVVKFNIHPVSAVIVSFIPSDCRLKGVDSDERAKTLIHAMNCAASSMNSDVIRQPAAFFKNQDDGRLLCLSSLWYQVCEQ
ncbi:hypothetical protein RRF57_000792 [Xylaria bambusicola]|uniref:Uncharacterized protein n=1 Tax=Xylaria bambusicola TaxID=326684 RepID=A0AAN7UFI7_9PEZI